jgi:hypothetical protein
MGTTQDVSLWDETDTYPAIVQDGAAVPTNRGVVLLGGSDGSNIRALNVNSSGQVITSTSGVTVKNVTATANTGAIANTASGNFTLTTNTVDQMLCLIEVRPTVASNNFDLKFFRDSARTQTVYWISGITIDEWVTEEYIAVNMPDSIVYGTIINNAGASRTFNVTLTIEVRG